MSFTGMDLINSPADPDNDIIVTAGFRDSHEGSGCITLATSIVKKLDAPWAPGTDAGGMEAGAALMPNRTYHAHAISNGVDGDVIFSPSALAPVLPTGFAARKRLFPVMTDGAGKLRQFLQIDGWCQWRHYDGVHSVGTYAKSIALTVPFGIKVLADLAFQAYSSGGFTYLSACDQDLGDATQDDCIFTFGGYSVIQRGCVWTDATGKINVSAGAASTLHLYNRGWFDPRNG